jgi:hypothetical protein
MSAWCLDENKALIPLLFASHFLLTPDHLRDPKCPTSPGKLPTQSIESSIGEDSSMMKRAASLDVRG